LTLVEPRTAAADAGAVVFARYAVPPNDLGYCGPDDSDGVLSGAAAGVVGPGLADRARAFDGAWVYLELIAAAAGARPLDARVVEAYWLGTALAGQVEPAAFAAAVRARFAGQSGGTWDGLGEAGGAVPHHGFHVFAVYPWLGLLRAGAPGPALEVLDRCRIGWGRVVTRRGDRVQVRSRGLTWTGGRLALGPVRTRTVLGPVGAPGDWVSLHWDRTCDVLGPGGLAALRRSTAHQLAVSNRGAGA
jgi:Family of unknown function (DUF6390)